MKFLNKKDRYFVFVSIFLTILSSIFFMAEIFVIRELISIADNTVSVTPEIIFILSIILITSYFIYYIKLRFNAKTAYQIKYNIGAVCFNNNLFNKYNTNEVTSNLIVLLTRKIDYVIGYFIEEIYDLTYEGMFVIIGITYLFLINWKIALISLLIYIIMIVISKHFSSKSKILLAKITQNQSILLESLNELVRNNNQVIQYESKLFEERYSMKLFEYNLSLYKSNLLQKKYKIINELMTLIREIIVIIVILVSFSSVNLSVIFILVYLSSMLSEPFRRVPDHLFNMHSTQKYRNDISQTYELKHVEYTRYDNQINEIEVKNLIKKYDSKILFNNLTFKFVKGKKYLISGPSGIGKTTLAQLICRLDEDYEGDILFNNVNLTKEELFTHYIYINQKNRFFNASVIENITLFDKNPNKTKLEKIYKLFNITLDEKLILNVNKNNLSSGEAQKILLARALYKDTDIIILDEPYSSLDTKNFIEIENLILSTKIESILIVISHQIASNIDKYDEILYL